MKPCVRELSSGGSMVIRLLRALLVLAIWADASADPLPPNHAELFRRGLELFERGVRPALASHCAKCHGGDSVEGDFDLTTREALLRGGAGGPAVKLFDAKASRLVRLIQHAEKPRMPAKSDRLPESTIAEIAAWIDHGAPYDRPLVEGKRAADRRQVTDRDRDWWAFRPLAKTAPPRLKNGESPPTGIDAFILARLEEKGLGLNPSADRRTLLRRASFQLLGLPPAPGETDAFEQDPSPDAWAKVTARMLASPRFGERWARHWLDLARFAESSGFEHDYDRPHAYHYRDFVIQALNADMPYDQFVRWQIAGDEFEPDEPLALMATGFLGAGVFPTQITANEVERTRYDAMDDMLSTTGTAMLGLTIGCARCHDHKVDPIPAEDYYRMLAAFTTTVRSDIELDLRPEEYRRAREVFDREHAPLAAARERYETDELPGKFAAWLALEARLTEPAVWEILEASDLTSAAGASFRRLEDGSYLAEGKNGDSDVYTFTADAGGGGLRALRLEALAHPAMAQGGPGRADNGNIGLSRIQVFAWPAPGGATNEVKIRSVRATFEQNSGSLSVAAALDDNPKTGWAVDPRFGTNHAAVFEFENAVEHEGGTHLMARLEFRLNTRHNIGRLRLSVTGLDHPEIEGEAAPARIATLLARLREGGGTFGLWPLQDRLALMEWWKPSDPGWRALREREEAHARQAPKPKLAKVLVCAEGFPPLRMHTQGADFFPETYFLDRGSTDLKRGVATPGFLQVLGSGPEAEQRWQWAPPSGAKYSGRRRALANWLTDPERGAGHLLARVVVNRLWQHHFGRGLVATPNDFGAQGAKPSHPELLDWLAGRLIDGGWRLKPIHQLILASAAYQQSAQTDPARSAADPAGELFSRRIPQRLEAEAVRDSLLFVAGVLDTRMSGPGTLDPSSPRRSIYLTVKRSQLAGAMQVFDAPEPLVSQGSRQTTTVAPQALLLMNSPQARDWAEAFARRFSGPADRPSSEALEQAWRIALNRSPAPGEREDAEAFLEAQTSRRRAEGEPRARELALADLAQVVLNLSEFIYAD